MSVTIEDGTGGSNRALVDDHGRLYVRANHVSHESHHASYHQNLFYTFGETVLAGTSATSCLHIENTGSDDAELYDLIFDCDNDFTVEISIGKSTYNSGGVLASSTNTFVGKPTNTTLTLYTGGPSANLSITKTSMNTILKFKKNAKEPFMFNFKGGVIIPKGFSMLIEVTSLSGTIVDCTLVNSFHEAGTKL